MDRSWTFAIDRGGTFTDVVARASDGRLRVEKLLSENAGQYADAALEAIERVLAEEGGTVEAVRMGTTIATNALLERKGERLGLAALAALDGGAFGEYGKNYIRFSYANSLENLREAVRRIADLSSRWQ